MKLIILLLGLLTLALLSVSTEKFALEMRLQEASKSGDIAEVKNLIEQGASPDWQNEQGWTAIMFATDNGHIKVIDMLGRSGANVNLQENDGWTALFFAAHNGDRKATDKLLRFGADASIGTKNRLYPHNIAGVHKHAELSQYLVLRAGEQAEKRKDSLHPLEATFWAQTLEVARITQRENEQRAKKEAAAQAPTSSPVIDANNNKVNSPEKSRSRSSVVENQDRDITSRVRLKAGPSRGVEL